MKYCLLNFRNFNFLLFILFSLSSFAQSVDDNTAHKRYWFYRTRLVNDFIKVGQNPGESLPLSRRTLGDINDINISQKGQIGGDAVSQLGEYVCVLATEYALLRDNYQDVEEVKRELFYALEAFNRLDFNAEQYWGEPNTLNGFFIREDEPCDFFCNNKLHFNYELNLSNSNSSFDPNCNSVNKLPVNGAGFVSNIYVQKVEDGKLCIYQSSPTLNNRNNIAMSHDQIHPLLAGLALINKYVPDWENYNTQSFLDGEYYIRTEARKMSVRILNNLKKFAGGWKVMWPDCHQTVPGASCFVPATVGGDASPYSFAIAETVNKINIDNNAYNSATSGLPVYHNAYSLSNGLVAWGAQTGYCWPKSDDAVKIGWEEAACNCDYMGYPALIPGQNYTAVKINPNVVCHSLYWASMLRSVLHSSPAGSGLDGTENFIDGAPCEGPYNYQNFNYPTYNWSSTDLVEHPDRRGAGNAGGFPGDYNGLDYMLYHNLYYLHANQPESNSVSTVVNTVIDFFTNLFGGNSNTANAHTYKAYSQMDVNDKLFWPKKLGNVYSPPTNYLGTSTRPAYISAFQTITSSAKILLSNSPLTPSPNYPTPNVTYRAGKDILLQDGFVGELGVTYHAFIQRYNCDSGGNYYRSTDSTNFGDDYTSEDYFDGPIDFVPHDNEITYGASYKNHETLNDNVIPDMNSYIESLSSLELYPNPSDGQFSIKYESLIENESINLTITNVFGSIVYEIKNKTEHTPVNIDISNLSKGIYFVKLTSPTGRNEVKKICIE